MWLDKASSKVHQIIDPVAKWVCNIGIYFVVVMVIVVVADVLLRLLRVSVPGLVETEKIMMVVVTFFSVAYIGVLKGHIRIDMFLNRFSPQLRAVLNTLNDLLGLIIMVIIAWRSPIYAVHNWGAYTSILHIPTSPAMLIVTVGSSLLCIVILADLLHDLGEVLKSRWWLGLALIVVVPLVLYTAPIWLAWLGASTVLVGILLFILMLVLIFLGVVVAFAMATAGFLGFSYLASWTSALNLSGSLSWLTAADFFLCVIPFFILMGSLCAFSGISQGLFFAARTWLGRLHGSLAMATVAGSAAFGAVCGDSLATAATMGKVSLPEMKRYKYNDSLATGCVAAGGTLGIMIPPSIIFIIYAILTEQSVGSLFIAGVFPGILIAGLMMATIYFQVRRNPTLAPPGDSTSLKEKLISLKGIWGMLILFVLVIGGIYGGIFTPVEAGAIGAAGALFFAMAQRMLSARQFAEALLDAARICGMILLVMVSVGFLSSSMALSKIPFVLAGFIEGLAVSRWVIFAVISLMYVILGCIMNIVPAIMLTLPILLPTIIVLGFDLVWLGVIMILMVMIGQITPPVGIICYVTKGIAPDVPLSDIFKGIFPLWGAMTIGLIVITIFPQIALFLPALMRGG